MFDNDNNENDSLDFGRILRFVLLQSKLVIAISLIGLLLSALYLFLSPKTYQVKSYLQVYSSASNPLESNFSSDMLLAPSGSSDVELIVNLYKTRTNIINIIEKFQLNIYTDIPSKIFFNEFIVKDNPLGESQKYFFKLFNNYFEIYSEDKFLISKINYKDTYENDELIVNLSKPIDIDQNEFELIYFNPHDLFSPIRDSFSLNITKSKNFGATEGFISVSYPAINLDLGRDIVNYANELFLNTSIEFETEKAKKAIAFIDDQLTSIKGILEIKKSNLKSFKEDNQSVNVNLEIESIIESISRIEESLNIIEVDLAEASSLYTATNPIFLSLKDRQQTLENQKKLIEEKIKTLPIAEQQYIDLYRSVQISQDLYLDLENRRLAFSIIEASTIGNIRVVDSAYIGDLISPTGLIAIIIFGFFFISGIFIAILRGMHFVPISNPAEINDAGLSSKIYGVLPVSDSEIIDNDDINLNRSFEACILNIESSEKFKSEECSVILLSSPTKENGKSFLSRNLAIKFSRMGKKTLLIDSDLIRGDQHNYLKKKKITVEDFYNINPHEMDDYKFSNNMYFIPKISRLVDTFNFLYSDRYLKKLNDIKEAFDVIIIDTGPILSVSDTSILLSYADLSFLVVRHSVNRMSQIQQSWFMSQQTNNEFDGFIYNAYKSPNSSYGYYALYGDYRYGYYADKYLYNYEYNKKNK